MRFLPKLPRIGLELNGQPLDADIALATGFLSRLRGLILSAPSLPARAGLLIAPCNSIHMLGMSWPIEALFLSKDLRVLKIASPLKPWRGVSACLGAWAVLEWGVGEASRLGVCEGSQLKQARLQAPPLEGGQP
jgi:uncharacterized membrane protein (UPF0127 family)